MGSDAMKMFAVVGEAVGEAVALQRVGCKVARVGVLVSKEVARQVECHFYSAPVVVLRMPGKLLVGFHPLREYDTAAESGQEWMYHLDSQVIGSPTTGRPLPPDPGAS
eukprot:RCo028778